VSTASAAPGTRRTSASKLTAAEVRYIGVISSVLLDVTGGSRRSS
jgi:hypothetical protein